MATENFTTPGADTLSLVGKLKPLTFKLWSGGASGQVGIEGIAGGSGGGSGADQPGAITDFLDFTFLDVVVGAASEEASIKAGDGAEVGNGLAVLGGNGTVGGSLDIDSFNWAVGGQAGQSGGDADGVNGGLGGNAPNGGVGGTGGQETDAGGPGAAPGGGGGGGSGDGVSALGGVGARGEIQFDWPDTLPTFSGTLLLGETLTATGDGTWAGHTDNNERSWQSADDAQGSNSNAEGTSDTLELILNLVGKYVRMTVAYDDASYQVPTEWQGPVEDTILVLPSISGTLRVGQIVTLNEGSWEHHTWNGTWNFHSADDDQGTNLDSENNLESDQFELTSAHLGKYIRSRASYDGGESEPAGPWQGPVLAEASESELIPSIGGIGISLGLKL